MQVLRSWCVCCDCLRDWCVNTCIYIYMYATGLPPLYEPLWSCDCLHDWCVNTCIYIYMYATGLPPLYEPLWSCDCLRDWCVDTCLGCVITPPLCVNTYHKLKQIQDTHI